MFVESILFLVVNYKSYFIGIKRLPFQIPTRIEHPNFFCRVEIVFDVSAVDFGWSHGCNNNLNFSHISVNKSYIICMPYPS